MYYVSTNTAIDCGERNSLRHAGIHLKGSLQAGDTESTISAWLINKHDLKFYSQNVGPFYDGYPLRPGDRTRMLYGWGVYLWIGSVISGYCCIHNENGTEQTSSLFLFTTFEDALNFRSGEPPKHYILTETLTIPQGDTRCFTKWGRTKPITVSKNSYYYFVVTFSSDNMNFTSVIDYTQNTVNTSEYSHPHKFKYNTETYLKFPTGHFHQKEYYIAICRVPEAESIHIISWGSKYSWEVFFVILLIVSILGCSVFCVSFGLLFFYKLWQKPCFHTALSGCSARCRHTYQKCNCYNCNKYNVNDETTSLIN